MRKTILALAVALAGALLTTPPASSAWVQPTTFVIGDSVTYLSADELKAKRPDWYVFAAGGVRMDQLPSAIDYFLRLNPNPSMIVVALGANGSPGWTQAQFKAAIAKVPATTRVSLVTPYRDPVKYHTSFSVEGARYTYAETYTKWMHEMDAVRPNTCIVPWRGLVNGSPSLVYDGVHPTATGQEMWASLTSVYSTKLCRP